MKWNTVAKCPHCCFAELAPFGVFFENAQPNVNRRCPSCGELITWEEASAVWVSDAIWWNPLTWRHGHWNFKQ